jgi:DnaK suppressor protein
MSDQFDRASELEQSYRDDALARHQSRQIERPHEQDGVRYCLACRCSICTGRLAANPEAVRCVLCQQRYE